MSELEIRRVFMLRSGEPFLGASSIMESSWYADIPPKIRIYKGAESIDDYLQRRPSPSGVPVCTNVPTSDYAPYSLTAPAITRASAAPVVSSLQVEILYEDPRRRCQDLFGAEGDYDRVIDQACRVLETRVRGAIGDRKDRNGNELIGTALLQEAFRSDRSLLRLSADAGEQRGAMEVYRGIIAFFRNSTGHRVVDTYTRDDARRFDGFVDLLLGMIASAGSSVANTGANDDPEGRNAR